MLKRERDVELENILFDQQQIVFLSASLPSPEEPLKSVKKINIPNAMTPRSAAKTDVLLAC